MKTFIQVMMSILILFFLVTVKAQTPVGLYEGLLGNTGAALTDSSAASYYNPSLLALKVSDSYALSGSTLTNFESKSLSEKTTSISIYPSYLSSIFISESLSHEIFLVNLSPTRIKNLTTGTVGSTYSSSETHRDGNQILAGYSMAFRKLGFALSYFIQYDQIQEFGFSETADLNGTLRITSNRKGNYSSMAGGVSVSGYNQFGNYTFGYNLKMRPAVFYTKNEAKNKNYIRGETLPTDYRESEENLKLNISGPISTTLIIGHSFKNGDHEFLTDSRFSEKSNNNKAFDFYQSFGYRLTSSSGHQFLCGMSHSFGGDTSFFGQNLYLSTGYSWLNKINRSTFGLYYFKSQLTAEITALGLTFGGEFSY